MSVENIVSKIIKDAEEKAKTIIDEYRKEAEALSNKRKIELEKERAEIKKKIELEAENHKKRKLQMANLDARKEILLVNQNIINDFFKKLEEKFLSMSEKEYLSFLEKKLIQSIDENNEYEFVAGKLYKESITQDFLDKINEKLKKEKNLTGVSIRLSSETGEFKAGFILRTGKIQINNTIAYLIKELRENVDTTLKEILFKE